MIEFTRYYGQLNQARGQLAGLPTWARTIVGIFAIPGVVLLSLSILAFVVSILALLLLTMPVYLLLTRLISGPANVQTVVESPGTKRVEATIVE